MASLIDKIMYYAQFVRVVDIIDILIVAFVIYKAIKLMKDTVAAQLIKGIIILVLATQISSMLNLYLMNYILVNVTQVGFIALVIVFQPELRRSLERMGRTKFGNLFSVSQENEEERISNTVSQICGAVGSLAQNKVGALIIVERQTKIGDIIRTGVTLNSDVSSELLVNVFVPNTPLHDGAVVIRENKIIAADVASHTEGWQRPIDGGENMG